MVRCCYLEIPGVYPGDPEVLRVHGLVPGLLPPPVLGPPGLAPAPGAGQPPQNVPHAGAGSPEAVSATMTGVRWRQMLNARN